MNKSQLKTLLKHIILEIKRNENDVPENDFVDTGETKRTAISNYWRGKCKKCGNVAWIAAGPGPFKCSKCSNTPPVKEMIANKNEKPDVFGAVNVENVKEVNYDTSKGGKPVFAVGAPGSQKRNIAVSDPTKEEMMKFLQSQFGRFDAEGGREDAEVAIYWFANFNHGGQSSNLYSVISTSPFRPGPISRGPEPNTMEEDMYNALEKEYGQNSEKQEEQTGTGAVSGFSPPMGKKKKVKENDSEKLKQLKQKRKELSKQFKNSRGEGDSRNTHLAQREIDYEIEKLKRGEVKESSFVNKLKQKLKEKTNPDGTYSDDMEDAIRMKKAEGLSEMTTSSAAGGQEGGTIRVPAWGTKNKLGSPGAIAATKKMKGWTVAKSISTEGK
jgi:hypothetical protein